MGEEWIVYLSDGSRQLVSACSLHTHDGHLYALPYGGGWRGPEATHTHAWAPGEWRRFYPRAKQDQIDRLKTSLEIADVLIERATDDDERERLTFFRNETVFDLEQLMARREAVG